MVIMNGDYFLCDKVHLQLNNVLLILSFPCKAIQMRKIYNAIMSLCLHQAMRVATGT